MAPSEKAIVISDIIYKELDGYGILPPYHMQSMAKNLSIICIEQAILYHPLPCNPDDADNKFNEYWQEVLAILKAQ